MNDEPAFRPGLLFVLASTIKSASVHLENVSWDTAVRCVSEQGVLERGYVTQLLTFYASSVGNISVVMESTSAATRLVDTCAGMTGVSSVVAFEKVGEAMTLLGRIVIVISRCSFYLQSSARAAVVHIDQTRTEGSLTNVTVGIANTRASLMLFGMCRALSIDELSKLATSANNQGALSNIDRLCVSRTAVVVNAPVFSPAVSHAELIITNCTFATEVWRDGAAMTAFPFAGVSGIFFSNLGAITFGNSSRMIVDVRGTSLTMSLLQAAPVVILAHGVSAMFVFVSSSATTSTKISIMNCSVALRLNGTVAVIMPEVSSAWMGDGSGVFAADASLVRVGGSGAAASSGRIEVAVSVVEVAVHLNEWAVTASGTYTSSSCALSIALVSFASAAAGFRSQRFVLSAAMALLEMLSPGGSRMKLAAGCTTHVAVEHVAWNFVDADIVQIYLQGSARGGAPSVVAGGAGIPRRIRFSAALQIISLDVTSVADKSSSGTYLYRHNWGAHNITIEGSSGVASTAPTPTPHALKVFTSALVTILDNSVIGSLLLSLRSCSVGTTCCW